MTIVKSQVMRKSGVDYQGISCVNTIKKLYFVLNIQIISANICMIVDSWILNNQATFIFS